MTRKVKLRDMPAAEVTPPPEANGDGAEDPAPLWRNRILRSGIARVDQLTGNPNNLRIHPRRQQEAMLDVLREVGIVQNVIVNEKTGFVVDGHMRVELAITEGLETIPVSYVDLDEDEELLVLHTFDPLGNLAVFHRELLQETTPLARQRAIPGSVLDAWLEEMARKNPVKVEPFPVDERPGDPVEEDDAVVPEEEDDEPQPPPEEEGPRTDTVVLLFDRAGHDAFMAKISTMMSIERYASVTEAVEAAVARAYEDIFAQQVR